jgi:hypothetical protein
MKTAMSYLKHYLRTSNKNEFEPNVSCTPKASDANITWIRLKHEVHQVRATYQVILLHKANTPIF